MRSTEKRAAELCSRVPASLYIVNSHFIVFTFKYVSKLSFFDPNSSTISEVDFFFALFTTNDTFSTKNLGTMERHKRGWGGFLILENKIKLTCILHMTIFLDICGEVDNSGSCSQDKV